MRNTQNQHEEQIRRRVRKIANSTCVSISAKARIENYMYFYLNVKFNTTSCETSTSQFFTAIFMSLVSAVFCTIHMCNTTYYIVQRN